MTINTFTCSYNFVEKYYIHALLDQLNQPVQAHQDWLAKVMVLGHAEMPWLLFVQIILVKMVSTLNTIVV